MKAKKITAHKASETSEPMVLQEMTMAPELGHVISVRAAKAHLSGLLDLVSRGWTVTITSDGEPKAVLSAAGKHTARKVFTGTWDQLKKMPLQTEGPLAEEIIRADRDGRGW